MYADSAADFTLALVLTLLLGLVSFLLWRRSGATSTLLRGAGVTLLPLALWLTHTLRLLSDVVDDVGNWATGLVFSPRVWVGLVVAAIALVLIGAGSALARRATPAGTATKADRSPRKVSRATSTGDPELDEIEALLRKRGIS